MIKDKILKLSNVTLTTPIRGQSVIPTIALDANYLHTKFGDYCFIHSGDMIVAIKIEMGHMTLTMPLLGVVCHL